PRAGTSPRGRRPRSSPESCGRDSSRCGRQAARSDMSSLSTPEDPGSVSGALKLPAGFADTFESRYVQAGDIRLHAVVGGEGPPLLLAPGWAPARCARRMLMPALASDFEVIAADHRGGGLSDKPKNGF